MSKSYTRSKSFRKLASRAGNCYLSLFLTRARRRALKVLGSYPSPDIIQEYGHIHKCFSQWPVHLAIQSGTFEVHVSIRAPRKDFRFAQTTTPIPTGCLLIWITSKMNNARDLIPTMSVGSYPPFPVASPSNPMYDLPALDFEAPRLQSQPPEEMSPSSGETTIYAPRPVDPTQVPLPSETTTRVPSPQPMTVSPSPSILSYVDAPAQAFSEAQVLQMFQEFLNVDYVQDRGTDFVRAERSLFKDSWFNTVSQAVRASDEIARDAMKAHFDLEMKQKEMAKAQLLMTQKVDALIADLQQKAVTIETLKEREEQYLKRIEEAACHCPDYSSTIMNLQEEVNRLRQLQDNKEIIALRNDVHTQQKGLEKVLTNQKTQHEFLSTLHKGQKHQDYVNGQIREDILKIHKVEKRMTDLEKQDSKMRAGLDEEVHELVDKSFAEITKDIIPEILEQIEKNCPHCKHCNCNSITTSIIPPAPIPTYNVRIPTPPRQATPRQHRSATPERRQRIQDPPVFNGNDTQHTFETWSRVFNGYLREVNVRDDDRKIDTLLRLLGQKPQGIMNDYYRARDEDVAYPGSFKDATKRLWDTYMLVDPSVEAQSKVQTIKQGNRTFASYSEEILPFCDKCQFGDIAVINFIRNNMNQALRSKMAGNSECPQLNYRDFISWVVKYETTLIRDVNWTYGPRPQRQTTPTTATGANTTPQAPRPVPARLANPSLPMNETKCFNCNKMGHMARNCPEPQKPRRENVRAVGTQPADIKEGQDFQAGQQ